MKRMQYPSKIFSILLFILTPVTALRADAVELAAKTLVVGINQTITEIPKGDLPGYDAQVTELKILRSTLHGTLGFTGQFSLQQVGLPLTFQPDSDFWSLGSDSFSYQLIWANGTKVTSSIILIAGRHLGERVCQQDFEGDSVESGDEWAIVGNPEAHPDAAYAGVYGMRASVPNAHSTTESNVRCTPPTISQREGSQMRVSVTVPDPANALSTTALLTAETGQGDLLLNLFLVLDQGAHSIHAEVLNSTTQSFVSTASWPVSTGKHQVTLDWWPDNATNDVDGGLAFWGDNIFIDRIFEPQDFDVDDLVFTFGLQGYTAGTASMDLDEMEVWQGIVESAYEVVRADGFENGLPDPWILGPGPVAGLSVTAAAAITGDYGLESDLASGYGTTEYLIDDEADGPRRFGVRFLVDTRSSSMEANDKVLLLDILDQNSLGGATEHLKVTLQDNASDNTFRLQGRARDGGALVSGVWKNSLKSVVSDGVHTIELHWAAATRSGASNGYLRLWLDGNPVPGVSGLANYGRTVQSVILGTLGINATSTGTLHLDDFESWKPTQ